MNNSKHLKITHYIGTLMTILAISLAPSCSKPPKTLILGHWKYEDMVMGSTKMWQGPESIPKTQLFGNGVDLSNWALTFTEGEKVKVTTKSNEIDCVFTVSPDGKNLVISDPASKPKKLQEFEIVSLTGKQLILEGTIVTEMDLSGEKKLMNFVAQYKLVRE